MYVVSRKDGVGESLTVDAQGLMAACEQLSQGQRFALDVRTETAPVAAPPAPPTARERVQAQHTALAAPHAP